MYTWAKIDEDVEGDVIWFHREGDAQQLERAEQFEIIDPEGDQIAVVLSQGEAETLVSHLNR